MTTTNSSLIHCDPGVMGGVAVFVGSRLPVTTLLACVDAGNSWERIVDSWIESQQKAFSIRHGPSVIYW